jgi:hypothetical protein
MSAMLAKAFGVKVIIAFLNDYELSQYPVPLWFLRMGVNVFSDLVIVPTNVNKVELDRTFSRHVVALQHGIDLEQFKPLQIRTSMTSQKVCRCAKTSQRYMLTLLATDMMLLKPSCKK